MGRLVDIQTALRPLKKVVKNWNKFVGPFWDSLNRLKRWTGPTQPDRDALWRLIFWKVYMIETWKFYTTFIQVFNLCYTNLGSISLIVWKLCTFRQRSSLGNFQQFFHHNFRLKWKFWILMVSTERTSSDLSEYTIFQIKSIIFLSIQIIFYMKNEKF